MLDRFRKRLGRLLGATPTPPDESAVKAARALLPVSLSNDPVDAATREARSREAKLILKERIHNRATVLLSEVRTKLVEEIHRRLDEEASAKTLKGLLEITLDGAYTARLDTSIAEMTTSLLTALATEFTEPGARSLFPQRETFVQRLATYRDEVIRRHMLEQVEVLALPTTAEAFAHDDGSTDALDKSITRYWNSCRESLDRFFRSVEMVLLDNARDGIRLESDLIRERLIAAQYRNGYRLLEARLERLLSEALPLPDDASEDERRRTLDALDRRIVDRVVVPLAYFIRERAEPEPRHALAGRAELFRLLIAKCVAIETPMAQTAEAVKPVLRKSVSQVRPIVLQEHGYLRTIIESLKPAAIHRTTALVTVFTTLVEPELDERALASLEHVVRLNRSQFRLWQAIRAKFPELLTELGSLDRIDPEDAELLTELIEPAQTHHALAQDLFLKLRYLDWPDLEAVDERRLMRLAGVVALTPDELSTWTSLYGETAMSAKDRSSLVEILVDRLDVELNGGVELRSRLQAVPVSVDMRRALLSRGYRPEDDERAEAFIDEIRRDIFDGNVESLRSALGRIQQVGAAVHEERVRSGAIASDGDPYFAEVWHGSDDTLVGLVRSRVTRMGTSPVEIMRRARGDASEQAAIEEKLKRQLLNQSLVYQMFYKLFSSDVLLTKETRRSLPSFVKKLYEPTEPNRHLLLSRFRYARELIELIDKLTDLIAEKDLEAKEDAAEVHKILQGLSRKVSELSATVEKSRGTDELARTLKEYERALKYLNAVVGHSINPWLQRQTAELPTEFEFRKPDVAEAVQRHAQARGIDWERDVESFEAHAIKGTLGCRALIRFTDHTSKVVLLDYDRRRNAWQVRHLAPRVTDVVRGALEAHGKSLPDDYDEKFEQPTFSLDEQSCRFFLLKRGVARVEATLVLDTAREDNLWEVAYLKFDDEVLIDRTV